MVFVVGVVVEVGGGGGGGGSEALCVREKWHVVQRWSCSASLGCTFHCQEAWRVWRRKDLLSLACLPTYLPACLPDSQVTAGDRRGIGRKLVVLHTVGVDFRQPAPGGRLHWERHECAAALAAAFTGILHTFARSGRKVSGSPPTPPFPSPLGHLHRDWWSFEIQL